MLRPAVDLEFSFATWFWANEMDTAATPSHKRTVTFRGHDELVVKSMEAIVA
jgi:hypothetical protein